MAAFDVWMWEQGKCVVNVHAHVRLIVFYTLWTFISLTGWIGYLGGHLSSSNFDNQVGFMVQTSLTGELGEGGHETTPQ